MKNTLKNFNVCKCKQVVIGLFIIGHMENHLSLNEKTDWQWKIFPSLMYEEAGYVCYLLHLNFCIPIFMWDLQTFFVILLQKWKDFLVHKLC
jgi:hypothetical protein